MTDDLVKRLRYLGDHASFEPHMHHTAADRIEELEAKLRKSALQDLAVLSQASEAYQAQLAAEAKLAKAMRVFDEMQNDRVGFRHTAHFRRRAAVVYAELTGDTP